MRLFMMSALVVVAAIGTAVVPSQLIGPGQAGKSYTDKVSDLRDENRRNPITPRSVPEPATLAMLATGGVIAVVARRWRNRKS
jgi:hypothetical protein